MCDKVPYHIEADAREAAKGMSREHKNSMKHYWCEVCSKWHVATEGKRRRHKRNNNKYPFRYQPRIVEVKKKK